MIISNKYGYIPPPQCFGGHEQGKSQTHIPLMTQNCPRVVNDCILFEVVMSLSNPRRYMIPTIADL